MGRFLHLVGGFAARRPWVVLGCWVLILVGVAGAVRTVGTETSNDLELPGTGSQQVRDLLEEGFPPQQNGTNPIVFHVSSGKLTDKASKDAVTDAVKAMRQAPHVHSVTNPLSSSGETAGLLSDDKRYAFAPVLMSFILNGDPTIKQFGVGLSVAVLLAGLLVVTLAPAAITLMGEAAWWLPRWLDRVLPHMHLEGEAPPAAPVEEAEVPELVVAPVYLPGQRTEPDEEQAPLPVGEAEAGTVPGPPT